MADSGSIKVLVITKNRILFTLLVQKVNERIPELPRQDFRQVSCLSDLDGYDKCTFVVMLGWRPTQEMWEMFNLAKVRGYNSYHIDDLV